MTAPGFWEGHSSSLQLLLESTRVACNLSWSLKGWQQLTTAPRIQEGGGGGGLHPLL